MRKTAIEARPSSSIAFAGPTLAPMAAAPMYVRPAANTPAGTSVYRYDRNLCKIIAKKSDLDPDRIWRRRNKKSSSAMTATVVEIIAMTFRPRAAAPSRITMRA